MAMNYATQKILNGALSHGPDSPLNDGFVYFKFAYEVKIITAGGEFGFDTAPTLIAKTCELPRWTADTQVVNVYNHKTLVQTKLTYEPITMTFYDQANNSGDNMIWPWLQEQFDSTDGSKAAKFNPLEIQIKMKNLSAPGAEDKTYTLKNAYIVDAQHDTLDYSSSEPVVWSITVRYEDLEAPGFNGPTPSVGAHIKPLPKPPAPPKKPQGSTYKPSTNTPVTKPPKADAQASGEAPSSQPMYTDPYGTTDGAAIMDVAGTAPKKEIQWPWKKKKPDYVPNGETSPTGYKWEPVSYDAQKKYGNPSTGSNSTNVPKKAPELSAKQKDYVAQETAYANEATGMNPEYKKAYIEALSKYPPVTNSPQSRQLARQMAETAALRTAPRYASQTRTNDNGVMVDRSNLMQREPSSAPARVGNQEVAPKINDTKSTDIVNTQAVRERNSQKATNRSDY